MKNSGLIFLAFVCVCSQAQNPSIVLDPFKAPSKNEGENEASGTIHPPPNIRRIRTSEICSLKKSSKGYVTACITDSDSDSNSDQPDLPNAPLSPSEAKPPSPKDTSLLKEMAKESPYRRQCQYTLYDDTDFFMSCDFLLHPPEEEETDSPPTSPRQTSDNKAAASQEPSGPVSEDPPYPEKPPLIFPGPVEKAGPGAVGKIVSITGDGGENVKTLATGTGFFLKDTHNQTLVITNYHVLGGFVMMLHALKVPSEDWFSEHSEIRLYITQGEEEFLITGVRSLSLLNDLAVLEVKDYNGPTLTLAENTFTKTPVVYMFGYPMGAKDENQVHKIMGTNPFKVSPFHDSFMTDHEMPFCPLTDFMGSSGGPALNQDGLVVGVISAVEFPGHCMNILIIPLDQIHNLDINTPLVFKTREDITLLIQEQESLFYNQVTEGSHKEDMILKATFYLKNNLFLSRFLHPMDLQDMSVLSETLLNTQEGLSDSDKNNLLFLLRRDMAQSLGFEIKQAAKMGSVSAQFIQGMQSYHFHQYEKARQWFEQAIQHKIPSHIYALSHIYYKKQNNQEQACRLLSLLPEVEVLNKLSKEYGCEETTPPKELNPQKNTQ